MIEVQDILNYLFENTDFINTLNYQQVKAFNSIASCRTSVLGTHKSSCDTCEFEKFLYNSCRNRHCPKCQTFKKEEWIHMQEQYLLDVPYFHVVFTIPDTLHGITFQSQKVVYNLFFKAVSESLKELGLDEKYIGANLGVTSVLHTWGQNLSYHPHIHCIIPGGGLTERGFWKQSKKKFFLPVKVLSRLFRGKFLAYLQHTKLEFHSSQKYLESQVDFDYFMSTLYQKEWVVYCEKPFNSASQVISYLGRYTHRVAITNNRIKSFVDGCVIFTYRDYKDSNKTKEMTLTAEEFARRLSMHVLSMHVLPSKMHKIRHYGLLAPNGKKERIIKCKRLTGTKTLSFETFNKEKLLIKLLRRDYNLCPNCETGSLCFKPPSYSYS